MNENKTVTHCEGECGCCGSVNLEFGPLEAGNNGAHYPFMCKNCGASGKAWYNIEYSKTIME